MQLGLDEDAIPIPFKGFKTMAAFNEVAMGRDLFRTLKTYGWTFRRCKGLVGDVPHYGKPGFATTGTLNTDYFGSDVDVEKYVRDQLRNRIK